MVSQQATQSGNPSTDWTPGDSCPCTPNDRCNCDGAAIENCGCYKHELATPKQRVDESVRITAEQYDAIRRRVLREHYTKKLAIQQAVVADERNDRKVNGDTVVMYTHADLKVSNTIAVLQDTSAELKSLGDENRDFPGVTRRALLDGES